MWLLLALACRHGAPPAALAEPASEPQPDPAPVAAPIAHDWQAPLGHDHPWIGRVLRADGRWVDEATLVADLQAAHVVLLGEKHDNPDHHLLQARLLAELVGEGTPVVFEQLDHHDPVDAARSPAELAEAVRWAESGWPDFALYEPVFDVIYDRGGAVVAGHPTRDEVRRVLSDGLDLPELDALRIRPLPEHQRAELEQEIVASHCGMADPAHVGAMVDAQVFKDAFMAEAIRQAGTPVVLIAGAGHTRPDRGVPHHLDLDTRTVAFREVQADPPGLPEISGEADYVWFTARVDDVDPCERFRQQLEGMRPR